MRGLREQVLGRIEGLEEREREKEDLLAELVPAMETQGGDTGALKVVTSSQ